MALSGTQRHSEALRGTQRHSVALSGTQRDSVALRSTQRHSEALRGTQRHSVALSGTQRDSEALRSTQRNSEALNGTQRHSTTRSASARSVRDCHLHAPDEGGIQRSVRDLCEICARSVRDLCEIVISTHRGEQRSLLERAQMCPTQRGPRDRPNGSIGAEATPDEGCNQRSSSAQRFHRRGGHT